MKLWQALALLSVSTGSAAAAEAPRLFQSTRNEGRGGTGIAAGESLESARFNPAALAESKARFQIRPLQIDGAVGVNTLDTVSELTKLGSVDDGLGFLRSFDEKWGKRQYLRGQFSVLSMRFGAFELQPFLVGSSWLELRQPALIEAAFAADTFTGIQGSYAFNLGPKWQVGATLRSIKRLSIASEMSFSDVIEYAPPSTLNFEDQAPVLQGSGIGSDLGLIWKPAPPLRLAFTVQNVGDTAFDASSSDKRPPNLKQIVSLGGMYRKKLSTWDLDWHAEYRDLLQREHQHFLRNLHLGAEVGRSYLSKDHDFGFLAGIQEGYITGGIFVDLWIARFDLSNYAVELGEVPGQRMDRRWAMSLQTSASF